MYKVKRTNVRSLHTSTMSSLVHPTPRRATVDTHVDTFEKLADQPPIMDMDALINIHRFRPNKVNMIHVSDTCMHNYAQNVAHVCISNRISVNRPMVVIVNHLGAKETSDAVASRMAPYGVNTAFITDQTFLADFFAHCTSAFESGSIILVCPATRGMVRRMSAALTSHPSKQIAVVVAIDGVMYMGFKNIV